MKRHHGWLDEETPKPRAVHMSTLGQDALSPKTGRPKRIPRAELAKGADAARHAGCVEHVEIRGGGASRAGLRQEGSGPRRRARSGPRVDGHRAVKSRLAGHAIVVLALLAVVATAPRP